MRVDRDAWIEGVVKDQLGNRLGNVDIREGRAVVGEATVAKSGKGSVTITLGKLATGDHEVKAYFLGSSTLTASSSRPVTLHVVKKKR